MAPVGTLGTPTPPQRRPPEVIRKPCETGDGQYALRSVGCPLVVHPAWPHRPAPQGASLAVADGGGLDRVLLALAGDEGGPSGASGLRPTDLGVSVPSM